MKKLTIYLMTLLCVLFTACGDSDDDPIVTPPSDDDEEIEKPEPDNSCEVAFRCILPEEFTEGSIENLTLDIKDINTGKKYNIAQENGNDSITAKLKVGLYDVVAEASMVCKINDSQVTYKVNGVVQSLEVTKKHHSVEIPLFVQYEKSGFVFAEIFFAGTKTPQESQYYADKYFVIYNNSDHTLYADSLAIAESKFLTVMKDNYTPDIMSEAMAVQALYMIPGNGKSHPVEPGGSILICDNALDHTKANPNSFDLTKANFEWSDKSTNPNVSDVNNPRVPDLKKIYCSTKTVWSPHNRGFTSFALVKMGAKTDDYLANYKYDYTYDVVVESGVYPMSGSCYKIPNEWIVDAVNCSVESLFKWLVVHPSLDRGWTHCGIVDFDENRYGKSVRRKVESRTPDGIAILKDTNNSTEDFDAEQTADPYHKF